MDMNRKTLGPLGRAAHLFFRCHVQLRWRGGFRLTLVERAATPSDSPEAQRAAREQAELSLILQQLAAALDEDEQIRPSLRHLGYVEQALMAEGLPALYRLPLDVLQRAHEQFEGLVTNWSPHGLASLRSRMAVAVAERAGEDDDLAAGVLDPPVPPAPTRARAAVKVGREATTSPF